MLKNCVKVPFVIFSKVITKYKAFEVKFPWILAFLALLGTSRSSLGSLLRSLLLSVSDSTLSLPSSFLRSYVMVKILHIKRRLLILFCIQNSPTWTPRAFLMSSLRFLDLSLALDSKEDMPLDPEGSVGKGWSDPSPLNFPLQFQSGCRPLFTFCRRDCVKSRSYFCDDSLSQQKTP